MVRATKKRKEKARGIEKRSLLPSSSFFSFQGVPVAVPACR
jgi:hypothetical protein